MFSNLFIEPTKLLLEAIHNNSLSDVKKAIHIGANIHITSDKARDYDNSGYFDLSTTSATLYLAIAKERQDIFYYLIEAGVEFNHPKFLLMTLRQNNLQMFNHLVHIGANLRCMDLLFEAIKNNNLELIKLLINHNDVNEVYSGYTALTKAIELVYQKKHKDYSIITFLLFECGVNVNQKVRGYSTALTLAVDYNLYHVSQLLLDAKADPNLYNPLITAVGKGLLDLTQLLLKAGADINKEKEGEIALHYAAQSKDPSMIKFLLGIPEISINYFNNKGMTPLMYATKNGNLEAIEALIQAGADSQLLNTQGKTAELEAKDNNTRHFLNNCIKLKGSSIIKKFRLFEEEKDLLLTDSYKTEEEKKAALTQYERCSWLAINNGIRDLRSNMDQMDCTSKAYSNFLMEVATLIAILPLPEDEPELQKLFDYVSQMNMKLAAALNHPGAKRMVELFKAATIFNKEPASSITAVPGSMYYVPKQEESNEALNSNQEKKYI